MHNVSFVAYFLLMFLTAALVTSSFPFQPCIIKFLDAIETPEKMFIVMEAAGGGELFDRLVARRSLPEPTIKFYFYQLCLAVQYLHQHRITHRDIKVDDASHHLREENILNYAASTQSS